MLAAAGTVAGMAMLLLVRSVAVAIGSATGAIVAVIILKHLALAIIAGSPLAAMFQKLEPKIRSHCPFTSS